ncbi:MAG: response regulator [bacterium]|nr:response regulator [bacterium]
MAKKILVIDDNPTIRDLVSFTLQLEGYEPINAIDGIDGLLKLDQLHHDELQLIITDIVMPKLDGFGVIKQVRKHKIFYQIPILVLTARGLEEDERMAKQAGATGFIRKPFEPGDLLNAVRKLLAPGTKSNKKS